MRTRTKHLLSLLAAVTLWAAATPTYSMAQTTIACSDPNKCVVAAECMGFDSERCKCVNGGDWDTATGDSQCSPVSDCVEATPCAAFADISPALQLHRVTRMNELGGASLVTTTAFGAEAVVSISAIPDGTSPRAFADLKLGRCNPTRLLYADDAHDEGREGALPSG